MKKKLSIKHLTAVVFLLILAVNFLLGLYPFALGTFRMLRGIVNGEKLDVSTIEYTFNDSFPTKGALITVNGGIQRLLGVRNVNDRVLLDNGHLTYTVEREDVAEVAAQTVAFSRVLAEQNIPFVYVNAPFKVCAEDKQLPVGVEDWANENVDDFLAILRAENVDALDLRASIREEGLDHYSLFYRTDHHWTAEAGFWAVTRIENHLTQADESFRVNSQVADLGNYDLTVHKNIFLGSAGRRVGSLFGGKDDLTVITPKFDTSLRFYVETEGLDRVGTFEQALLFPEKLTEGSDFETARYDIYSGHDYARLDITNYALEQGLEIAPTPKRLLVFKDSFSSVVIPFLAMGYEQLCFVDLRLYQGDIMALVEEFRPDAVLALYNGGAVTSGNAEMFDFLS